MDDQVQTLVEKVWAKFLVTPPERRLSECISEVFRDGIMGTISNMRDQIQGIRSSIMKE